MIQALAGSIAAATTSQSITAPFGSTTTVIQHQDTSYRFVESAGVGRNQLLQFADLQRFIKLVKSTRNGVSLLIFVTEFRITAETQPSYELFAETLTRHKIPIVVVVTKCEASNPPSSWTTPKNIASLEMVGVTGTEAVIATSFAKSANKSIDAIYGTLRQQSIEDVWSAIEAHATTKPVDFLD